MKQFRTKLKQTQNREITLKEAFRSENGAIDLASIMVGIIVIGMIGGVITATVFAVIPWSQDNAAKQQLDSVVAAESAYMGLSSTNPPSLPAGLAGNSYGNSSELETAGLLKTGLKYCVSTTNTGPKSYEAFSMSSSGKIWSATDKVTKPVIFTGTLPADCQFIADGVATTTSSPDTPYVDPTPTLTTLTYNCPTNTTGSIPMKTALTGKEIWTGGFSSTTNYTNAATAATKTLTAGTNYTVTFDGTYSVFDSSTTGLAACLRAVNHWGSNTGVTNATSAFKDASNLISVPAHIPLTITNMYTMFNNASQINDPNISNWDVSNVTNMAGLFMGATAFNQPLNGWNTSNVTVLASALRDTSFNQSLSNWNTSKVTNMYRLFYNNNSFNQSLGQWNTSSVINMSEMFRNAVNFDQSLNGWDTSKVTDMSYMFSGAFKFNQPLNNWVTSNVTTMTEMFYYTTKFNQNIKSWNVSKVGTNNTNFRTGSALTAANSPF